MSITDGIYPHLSNEDYHADGAISRSGIMKFLESPYKYYAEYLNPNRPVKESTKAMDFGTAFHTIILEPELFDKKYIMKPQTQYLKDIGKNAWEMYKTTLEYVENCGLEVLSYEDFNLLADMNNALMNNKQARELIENATYESSYFWTDEHSGLQVKCRPDILHTNMIVDLKTCVSASSQAYQKAMIDGCYHIQGAMIREGVKKLTGRDISTVINICCEKTYPFEVGIKIISESALEAGHMKFKQALLDIKRCIEYNDWCGYEPEIVDLPTWAT